MIKPSARLCITALLASACILLSGPAHGGWGDFLKGVGETLKGGGGRALSKDRMVRGLKEALEVGTRRAVDKVSTPGGYLGNPEIRIPLPKAVERVESGLRAFGYGSQVDAFEESMNRAAEKAAPAALDLFGEALRGMTFEDAEKILKGRDNEATLYFKDKTRDRLLESFKPLVHQAMQQVGVTRQYQDLEARARKLPFGESLGLDLDQYVSEHALDGLFLMLEREEKKIRSEPAARVTDLLKEVFGNAT